MNCHGASKGDLSALNSCESFVSEGEKKNSKVNLIIARVI